MAVDSDRVVDRLTDWPPLNITGGYLPRNRNHRESFISLCRTEVWIEKLCWRNKQQSINTPLPGRQSELSEARTQRLAVTVPPYSNKLQLWWHHNLLTQHVTSEMTASSSSWAARGSLTADLRSLSDSHTEAWFTQAATDSTQDGRFCWHFSRFDVCEQLLYRHGSSLTKSWIQLRNFTTIFHQI